MAQPDIYPDSQKPHIRTSINKGFLSVTNTNAIFAALLHHNEDNFSKMTVGNKSQQIRSEKMIDQISQRGLARLGAVAT